MCAPNKTKYYENPTMLFRVIAKNIGDVFFETHCICEYICESTSARAVFNGTSTTFSVVRKLQTDDNIYTSITARLLNRMVTVNYCLTQLVHQLWNYAVNIKRHTICAKAKRFEKHCKHCKLQKL